MSDQQLILVNENDEPVGVLGKTEVHQRGLLHRAFSVFIFDGKGRMLLQQRAAEKYHGGNLWTNACCSHPMPGEETLAAAKRRLNEELGFNTEIEEIFSFTYRAEVENNLIEHEFDHVFAGKYEGSMMLNPNEVAAVKYEEMNTIIQQLESHPEKYTSWFKIAFPKIENWWKAQYNS